MRAIPIFHISINYPRLENKLEYDVRTAKAVARVLVDLLPLKKIDEIIEDYKLGNN